MNLSKPVAEAVGSAALVASSTVSNASWLTALASVANVSSSGVRSIAGSARK